MPASEPLHLDILMCIPFELPVPRRTQPVNILFRPIAQPCLGSLNRPYYTRCIIDRAAEHIALFNVHRTDMNPSTNPHVWMPGLCPQRQRIV